jgi:hypothetical protein
MGAGISIAYPAQSLGINYYTLPSTNPPAPQYDTSLNSAGQPIEDVYDGIYSTKFYNSEEDYMDNRLSRDYKSRQRQFDQPSSSSYNKYRTNGYDSSCSFKSYGDEQDDEECECLG